MPRDEIFNQINRFAGHYDMVYAKSMHSPRIAGVISDYEEEK